MLKKKGGGERKAQFHVALLVYSYLTFKEEFISIFHKSFQEIKEEETLSNSFYKASIILIPKTDKNIVRKLQTKIPYKYRHKIFNKIPAR